jgi:co-chaperonin GroES (HSP10)
MPNADKGGIMRISPRNRHIVVEIIDDSTQEEPKSNVLLPESYKKEEKSYTVVKVLESSPTCTINIGRGDKIIVENSMVQKFEIGENEFYLVLENYVYGVLTNR